MHRPALILLLAFSSTARYCVTEHKDVSDPRNENDKYTAAKFSF